MRVRAAAVNFPDILMIQGKYQHRPELPFIVGGECAGEVIAVGDGVTRLQAGRPRDGRRPSAAALPKSINCPPRGCGAFRATPISRRPPVSPTAYLTAYVSLVRRGDLQAGETLLVHGAAGGVGLAAVDLRQASGRDRDRDRLDRRKARLPERLWRRSCAAGVGLPRSGEGADRRARRRCDLRSGRRRCVRRKRALHRASAGGCWWWVSPADAFPSINANMPLIKGFSVVGVRAGEYGRKFPEKGRENIAAIDALLAEGKVRPHIHARLAAGARRGSDADADQPQGDRQSGDRALALAVIPGRAQRGEADPAGPVGAIVPQIGTAPPRRASVPRRSPGSPSLTSRADARDVRRG